jgi:hypothetical protein
MARRRRVLPWLFTGFLSSAAFQACGSNSEDDGNKNGNGLAGTSGNNQGDGMVVDAPPGAGAGGESPYDPLCGVSEDSCIPDLATGERSCMPTTAGAPAGTGGSGAGRGGSGPNAGTGGSGGTLAESGAGGEGGAAGQGEGGQSGIGFAGGEAGRSEAGGAGEPGGSGNEGGDAGAPVQAGGESFGGQATGGGAGEPAASGQAGAPAGTNGANGGGAGTSVAVPRSCQVELDDGEPRAVCAPSGRGLTGEGCFSSADCTAGLACVGESSPGLCRPYCCAGDSACSGGGSHCTEQHLVGTTGRPPVPVCMPATGCSLADEYPCPEGATCSCPEKQACIVVTGDGKTSCVPAASLPGEGEGEAGDPCPCAWDHVCSEVTRRCAKLCPTAAPGDACSGARCQFVSGLPLGWGVCLTPADAG